MYIRRCSYLACRRQIPSATSQVTLPIPQGAETIAVWDVAVGDGSVWVHAEPHLLYRIDPKAMA